MKKTVQRLLLCCLVFCLAFAFPSFASAEDTQPQPGDEGTLTVMHNDDVVKIFTKTELEEIAEAEGNQQYFYSAYNTMPNFKEYPTATERTNPDSPGYIPYIKGATVLGILSAAGITDQLQADSKLIFSDYYNYTGSVTYAQLTEPRYYYPNGSINTKNGAFDDGDSTAGKVLVPAVISLNEANYDGKFFIGQKYTNEQTTQVHVDGMTDGGYIKIYDEAGSWDEAVLKDRVVRGMIPAGIKLHFDTSVLSVLKKTEAKIHFTTDGTEPDQTSRMYNFVADRWFSPATEDSARNYPDTSQLGHMTLKTRIIGLGKNDGPVTTFEFDIVSQEEYDQAIAEEDNLTYLSECKASLASTSFIYSGSAKTPAVTVKHGTIILKKGTDYKVSYSKNTNIGTATVTVTGIGSYTGTLKKTFTIKPGKVVLSKVIPAKRALTVKYGKKAGGVKYRIAIRQAGRSWKKYNTTLLSKKFTKLSSKKYFYIKVRAFKIVNGKTYYGSWSLTKKAKTK